MFNQNYNVIGVMSGTSLDGIDFAHISFTKTNQHWLFEILETETISYPESWLNKLKNAITLSESELKILDENYTDYLAENTLKFIDNNNIKNLDAVCSHGHTIMHQPQNGFTLQIGNLPKLSTIINQKVVCNFRVDDVKLGGQGAPLVPIGDRLLFSDYDFCLNLGGFSNISFEENNKRIAFDISPVNTVINFYANTLGYDYDDKGKIASSGNINKLMLNELNGLAYYTTNFPKSLGFEFVKNSILPLIEKYNITTEDKMRTFVEHIVFQTQKALIGKKGKLLITGGGVYNDFLIKQIKKSLPNLTITIPEKKTIEFKEALIFGLLGVLKLREEINVLCSVTGATKDHSSGKIFL